MKKLFLAFAACLMAFSVSAAELNIYASGLKSGAVADGKVQISYVLNAPATALALQVIDAEGTVVKTIDITGDANLTKGAHADVEIDLAGLAAGTYNWAIKASAAAREALSEDIIGGAKELSFFQPRDMEVDVNPESPFFGQIYLTNSRQGQPTEIEGADLTISGVYVIDALLNKKGGYAGGISWSGNDQTLANGDKVFGPFRVQVDERGYVYVNEGYTADISAIYVMDPANPSEDFVPVLSTTEKQYTRIRGFELVGEGDERKLAINDNTSGLYIFEIGNNTNVTTASTLFAAGELTGVVNTWNSLESDGRGGFWALQYRYSDSKSNSVINHINAEGTRDYNSADAELGLANTQYATMNLNKDRTLMACVNGLTDGIVYSIAWSEDGIPTLTKEYNFYAPNAGGTAKNITAVAFDYAGNLYVGSPSTERMYVYATPSDNICTTPAAKKYTLSIAGEATGLENAAVEKVDVRKVVENGQVYIIREGVRYNVLGTVVR